MQVRLGAQLAALVGAGLLGVSSCGSEPPATNAAGPREGSAPIAAAAKDTELRYEQGRVSVAREQALQLALLEELAARAGFVLEVGVVAPRSLTLRLDAVPLLDAISALLEGTAFRATYAVDPETGAHVLARLSVGEPAAAGPLAASAKSGDETAASLERNFRSERLRTLFEQRRVEAEERSRLMNLSADERHAREAEAIEQLANADGARRAGALAAIDPAGEASARIFDLAKSDPDPGVRAAAVARLGDADTYQATSALLDALADPSPRVVISALEAIEFTGDPSLLERIEPLANHPDPDVRAAASEAIEGLR